jgi:hypothetical protein
MWMGSIDFIYSPSVTIPSVPSAPMKSFVVSNPVDDFLALCLVLMTLPEGSTAVCNIGRTVSQRIVFYERRRWKNANHVKEPLAFCSAVPHRVRYDSKKGKLAAVIIVVVADCR